MGDKKEKRQKDITTEWWRRKEGRSQNGKNINKERRGKNGDRHYVRMKKVTQKRKQRQSRKSGYEGASMHYAPLKELNVCVSVSQ